MADDLTPPGIFEDEQGRYHSPWIQRHSAPSAVDLPSAAQLKGMPPGQMSETLTRYGWEDSWDAKVEMHSKYLADFNIRPGDPRYAEEIANLDDNIQRSMLGATRRVAQRTETLYAIDGDVNAMTIYIPEGDDPCDGCMALVGTEMTYAQRVEAGAMPGDACAGHDACLCDIGVYTG